MIRLIQGVEEVVKTDYDTSACMTDDWVVKILKNNK